MSYPTVFLAVDDFGRGVLDGVRRTLPPAPWLDFLTCEPGDVEARLHELLRGLLKAGRLEGQTRQRLEVFAFVDISNSDGVATQVCEAASRVIGGPFANIFPSVDDVGQRDAALHLVVLMPRLVPDAAAHRAVRDLVGTARAMQGGLPYPLLARVWLVATQTTAGITTLDDVQRAASAFCSTLASERGDEGVSARTRHLRDPGRMFGFVAVGTLDVPEEKLRRYATYRALFDGLSTLAKRVTRHVANDERDQTEAALERGQWAREFLLDDGEAKTDCLRVAARMTGAAPSLPDRIKVGAFDDEVSVRDRYPMLFEPGTKIRSLNSVDRDEIHAMLSKLDRLENAGKSHVEACVVRVLEDVWRSDVATLAHAPRVAEALRRALARFEDEARQEDERREGAPLGFEDLSVAEAPDPGRKELETGLEELPTTGRLRAIGLAAGVAAATLVLCMLLAAAEPAQATTQTAGIVVPCISVISKLLAATQPPLFRCIDLKHYGDGPRPPSSAEAGYAAASYIPWIVALAAACLAGFAWAWWVGNASREGVRRLLVSRRDGLRELWARGGGGQLSLRAQAQIDLRVRRIRRAARAQVSDGLLRLEAITKTVLEAGNAARSALVDLGVGSPQAEARSDDLLPLLEPDTLLHANLVEARLLPAWIAARRQSTPDAWANLLVEKTWQLAVRSKDVPCGDQQEMLALAEEETARMRSDSMLADNDIVESAKRRVREFVRRVPGALGPACQPRDVNNGPVAGARNNEVVVVVPKIVDAAFCGCLSDASFTPRVVRSDSLAARTVFIRTWEELSLDEIARGSRLDPHAVGLLP
jgi:hypothetical protein